MDLLWNLKILLTQKDKMKEKIKSKLILFDKKVNIFIPDPKVKKIAYIAIGSLFGFMFLIIFLGLLLSPLRNQTKENNISLNKTKIIVSSPKPEEELSETQKQILNLETKIKEMRFPESILNIPTVERNISI